jgi:predicted GH43/DUF377 family glycosyl hydrolase
MWDPCVINIDGLWHMYYAGYFAYDAPEKGAGFTVRTSTDLINWSVGCPVPSSVG